MLRRSIGLSIFWLLLFSSAASAQMTMPMKPQTAPMEKPMTMPEAPLRIGDTRDGSGTSWVPDESVMAGPMLHSPSWMLMLHWNGFAQFVKTQGSRGDQQFGSVNWLMAMAQRNAGGGLFSARVMLSAEPLTVGKCGYPNLLQTGESCDGLRLHDRQHPHDVFMEVAADYRRPLSRDVAIEFYGGLAGEPALGPVAFPHRASAMPNPIAPISHHWLDSSHISFGVVTGGVYGRKWKAEGSIFNGREPDDKRFGFDLGALDSYSGRLWLMPTSRLALQVSAGHLTEAEREADGHSENVDRVTASAMYHRLVRSRLWATTIAWGRNSAHNTPTSAFLAETSVDLTARDQWFSRAEITGKTADDLVLPRADETFTITKLQTGYTRWLPWTKVRTGIGGSIGMSVVPDTLRSAYGSRAPIDFSVFLTIRPR